MKTYVISAAGYQYRPPAYLRAHLRGTSHVALCGFYDGGWLSGAITRKVKRCRRCQDLFRAAKEGKP